MTTLRLLPFAAASGPGNMAADEVMLLSAADRGIASLRFYSWDTATLSLGYFQPAAARLDDERLAGLPWVRRATGGAAILHDPACELTYSIALPSSFDPKPGGESWICRMHKLIRSALADMEVKAKLVVCGEEQKQGPTLCFLHHTAGDLVVGESKIAGSAQRKQRGALLQHGSILLEQSPHAPQLPGIREASGITVMQRRLAATIATRFVQMTRHPIRRADWTAEESGPLLEAALAKFSSREWNEKR